MTPLLKDMAAPLCRCYGHQWTEGQILIFTEYLPYTLVRWVLQLQVPCYWWGNCDSIPGFSPRTISWARLEGKRTWYRIPAFEESSPSGDRATGRDLLSGDPQAGHFPPGGKENPILGGHPPRFGDHLVILLLYSGFPVSVLIFDSCPGLLWWPRGCPVVVAMSSGFSTWCPLQSLSPSFYCPHVRKTLTNQPQASQPIQAPWSPQILPSQPYYGGIYSPNLKGIIILLPLPFFA